MGSNNDENYTISNNSWWNLIGFREYLKKNNKKTAKSPIKKQKDKKSLCKFLLESGDMSTSPFMPSSAACSTPLPSHKFTTIEEQESWEDLRRTVNLEKADSQVIVREPPSPGKYRFLRNDSNSILTRSTSLQPSSPEKVKVIPRNAHTPKATRYTLRSPSLNSDRASILQYSSSDRIKGTERKAVTPSGIETLDELVLSINEESPMICSTYHDSDENDELVSVNISVESSDSDGSSSLDTNDLIIDEDPRLDVVVTQEIIESLPEENNPEVGEGSQAIEEQLPTNEEVSERILDNFASYPLSRIRSRSDSSLNILKEQLLNSEKGSETPKMKRRSQDDMLHSSIMYQVSEDLRRMAAKDRSKIQQELLDERVRFFQAHQFNFSFLFSSRFRLDKRFLEDLPWIFQK